MLCKVLDCSIKILMHKEFIDVLLPWVSKIVHDASSTLVPTPKKGAQLNKANAMRNPNNQPSILSYTMSCCCGCYDQQAGDTNGINDNRNEIIFFHFVSVPS